MNFSFCIMLLGILLGNIFSDFTGFYIAFDGIDWKQKKTRMFFVTLVFSHIMINVFFLLLVVMLKAEILVHIFTGELSWAELEKICVLAPLRFLVTMAVSLSIRVLIGRNRKVYDFQAGLTRRAKALVLLSLVVILASVVYCSDYCKTQQQAVFISGVSRRVMAEDASPEDEDPAYISVITLRNDSLLTCTYERLYLSLDEEEPESLTAVNVTIPAHGSYSITTDVDEGLDIAKNGDSTIHVWDRELLKIAEADVPAMQKNVAAKRSDENGEWELEAKWVPEEKAYVAPPVFSQDGGFFDGPFDLKLSCGEGLEIYYTLDSSMPTKESIPYDAPIHVVDRSTEENSFRAIPNVVLDWKEKFKAPQTVDKAFVVRAVAVDADGNMSDAVTNTYFVGLEQYRGQTVISLVADPEALFGPEGIYVTGAAYDKWYTGKQQGSAPTPNFLQRGDEWEREANLEVMEDALYLNQNVGIKIQGATTRSYVLKRFSVYAKNKYGGSRYFDQEIFPGKKTHSFVLREGKENAVSLSLFQDQDRFVAVPGIKPVVFFLNGEFWQKTFAMEKYSDDFFAETYDMDRMQATTLKIGSFSRLSAEGKALYNKEIKDFIEKNDLSDPSNYERFNRRVNIQSYLDFECINAYLANSDITDSLNVYMWRSEFPYDSTLADGRWSWALYDMDLHLYNGVEIENVSTAAEINPFAEKEGSWRLRYQKQPIFAALNRNPEFRKQFVITMMDLINTVFVPERVEPILWRHSFSLQSYHNGFFLNRAEYMYQFMTREFGLSGEIEEVQLSVNNAALGAVQLNTMKPDLKHGTWTGRYYQDYPVTLTALPEEGCVFKGWTVNGKHYSEPMIQVPIKEGVNRIYAEFQRQ